MAFADDEIMKQRIEAKAALDRNIEKGIIIDGVFCRFMRIGLFNEKMSTLLPEDFEPMTEENKKRKYPSEYRPQVVVSNANGTVAFSFSYFADIIYSSEIYDCILGFKAVIKKVSPANTFFSLNEINVGKSKLGYCEYQSYAIDDDIYNVMFVTPICNQLMLGTFSCSTQCREKWESIVYDVMSSIQEQEDGYNGRKNT